MSLVTHKCDGKLQPHHFDPLPGPVDRLSSTYGLLSTSLPTQVFFTEVASSEAGQAMAMLIRLRPGWEVLRQYLAGEGDHGKLRWGAVEGQ